MQFAVEFLLSAAVVLSLHFGMNLVCAIRENLQGSGACFCLKTRRRSVCARVVRAPIAGRIFPRRHARHCGYIFNSSIFFCFTILNKFANQDFSPAALFTFTGLVRFLVLDAIGNASERLKNKVHGKLSYSIDKIAHIVDFKEQ